MRDGHDSQGGGDSPARVGQNTGPTSRTYMRHTVLRMLLAALAVGPAIAQTPSSDVSVGVFPFLVGNMDGRIQEIVTNCQTYGIDTVYVSVFRATGPSQGDLWITDSAGDWNPAWGPVRPNGNGIHLQNLITACQAANLRVVPVLKCFSDNVQPDNQAHKQYLLGVIDYFVDAWQANGQPIYDVDGLALDYVRYVGGSNVQAANVTNFVRDVKQRLGSLSLHAYLIASRYTFDGPVYNSQFASYSAVINSLANQYGQHWEQMAAHVDVLMPMAYSADGSIYNTYAGHQAYVRQTASYARTAATLAGVPGRRVVPTVKTYTGEGETTTTQTIEASITGALLGGANGYQSFRYQMLVNTPSWWTKMQQFAVPGCNWPAPVVAGSTNRLTRTFDAALSRDHDQASGTLQFRVDHGNDGTFDTAWLPLGSSQDLVRRPGAWLSAIQVRDADGHVATVRRRVTSGSAVTTVPNYVSGSGGGVVQIQFAVGPAGAGNAYLALASLAGTSPGFVWYPDFPVPINVDFVTNAFLAAPNNAFLSGGLGAFDASGNATATLTVPPALLSAFTWQSVSWSFVSIDGLGRPACVGDARSVLILP